jgi:hypothetical protein
MVTVRNASKGVSMVRVWLAFAITFILVPHAWALDDAARKKYIEDMKSESSVGGSSFLDVMEKRFPADFNTMIDRVAVRDQERDRTREFALLMVKIYGSGGKHIKAAPAPSLKAILQAHRSVVEYASRTNPELCKTIVVGSQAPAQMPREMLQKTIAYRLAILHAIADGRDTPVASRGALMPADTRALEAAVQKRGVDTTSWSVLDDPKASKSASASAICDALLSYYDVILATEGLAGEKLLAEQAMELLTVEAATYRSMM